MLENLLLKLEPSEITPFSTTISSVSGGEISPGYSLSLVEIEGIADLLEYFEKIKDFLNFVENV